MNAIVANVLAHEAAKARTGTHPLAIIAPFCAAGLIGSLAMASFGRQPERWFLLKLMPDRPINPNSQVEIMNDQGTMYLLAASPLQFAQRSGCHQNPTRCPARIQIAGTVPFGPKQ